MVTGVSWLLKLEVHPGPAAGWDEFIARAAIGTIPSGAVIALYGGTMLLMIVLALRAPSERMINWADIPSPFSRWVTASQTWGRGLVRGRRPDDDVS